MEILASRHTAAFPKTLLHARTLSKAILADRAANATWRAISEKMSITRLEAMSLAHTLPQVEANIRVAR